MKLLGKIEIDKKPLEIMKSIEKVHHEPEMDEYDLSFICGLIREYKPKKCVEVGIAGGGTSAIILNALHKYCGDGELHVVDKSYEYYHDRRRKSGFLGEQAYDLLSKESSFQIRYEEHLGGVLPTFLDDIGGGIDFVLLDTIHLLPGEVLDFLAILPYLHVGSLVVLHDVSLNCVCYSKKNDIATGLLFNSVVANKLYDFDATNNLPNIAAFSVTEDTTEYILNVFGILWQTWSYLPSKDELDDYSDIIKKYYDSKTYDFYMKICSVNAYNLQNISFKDKMILIGKLLLNRASSQYLIKNNR